jgi:hypothetical protein
VIRRLLPWLLLAGLASGSIAQPSPERKAATERDYRDTLSRLGISRLRTGADGMHPDAPNAANYDESKARSGEPLPPLLRDANGGTVDSSAKWWRVRRPEIAALLEREVYGRVPASAPVIKWKLIGTETRDKAGMPVMMRHFIGRAAADSALAIRLDVTLPAGVSKRVPLLLELGFPEGFHFPGFNPPPATGPDWMEQILARGWGYAILVPNTVQPDDGAGLDEGVIGVAGHGQARAADQWGVLRAWAWGASRALDLLETDPGIDPKRIGIEGLSRYGKAALIAMAYDQRFSIGFIGSSGAGGAKLLRRNFGEQVENLASSGEYHWFSPNFLKYAGPLTPRDLPVDAHMLIALAAPRPLFIGAGTVEHGDGWVDPRGSFEAAQAASAAYRLLGVEGLVAPSYPATGELRAKGRIAFRQHEDGHSNTPNWPDFLAFAARQWSTQR